MKSAIIVSLQMMSLAGILLTAQDSSNFQLHIRCTLLSTGSRIFYARFRLPSHTRGGNAFKSEADAMRTLAMLADKGM